MSDADEPTFIDFETRSAASLKKLGSRNYAAHPTTELVCCVLRREDDYEIVTPYTPLGRKGPRLASGSRYVAAHNAVGFDRHIWARLGWPEPKEWIDTSELMRVGGYPKASIEYLGEHVVGIPKDKVGNALTKSLSKVSKKKRARGKTPLTWQILERVIQYCKTDVDIMFEGFHDALHIFHHADIAGIEQADRALNDRGVCFDSDLARELLEIDATLVEGVLAKAGVTIKQVRSRPQFIKLMADLGVAIPNCQARRSKPCLTTRTRKWRSLPRPASGAPPSQRASFGVGCCKSRPMAACGITSATTARTPGGGAGRGCNFRTSRVAQTMTRIRCTPRSRMMPSCSNSCSQGTATNDIQRTDQYSHPRVCEGRGWQRPSVG
jgi:hypothetical protein